MFKVEFMWIVWFVLKMVLWCVIIIDYIYIWNIKKFVFCVKIGLIVYGIYILVIVFIISLVKNYCLLFCCMFNDFCIFVYICNYLLNFFFNYNVILV